MYAIRSYYEYSSLMVGMRQSEYPPAEQEATSDIAFSHDTLLPRALTLV